MTIEALIAIAELCRATGSGSLVNRAQEMGAQADKRQLSCQQYYITCINTQDTDTPDALEACILKRDENPYLIWRKHR